MTNRDLDYIADSGEAVLAQRAHGGRVILYVVLLLLIAVTAWANWAELDEVVRGQGRVIPSGQVQIVQNLEGGIVRDILVQEGSRVAPGDVLLRIDDTRFGSSLKESRIKSLSLEAQLARLLAEADGATAKIDFPIEVLQQVPELAANQERQYRERRAQLEASLSVFEQQLAQRRQQINELQAKASRVGDSLKLARRELELTRPLQRDGAISEVEILRLERQVNELGGEQEQARLGIPRARAEAAEIENRMAELRAEFKQQARAEFNEVAAELAALSAANVAVADRVERTTVRSPTRGVIKKLLVNTPGGVVQPGMDLVEIVPLDDSLLVEARVRPKDIAFLRPDLAATVKLTAYDYAIYGGLRGQVEHISADTFENEREETFYLVRVRTERNALGEQSREMPIMPGMTAEVDILTGKRTVLAYLLKPVLRAKANALREP